jgi:uncharacterized lipoprotein NlpE involved in copper resistance
MSTFNIQVTPQNNTLLVIDNDQNQVVVTNPITSVVEVNTLGPPGPPGPPGASFPYTGSAAISGSLVVTGSITATQGFTGSLLGTASYALNAINAEGGSVFQYSTVDDQLNDWAGNIINGVYGTVNITGSLLNSASYSGNFQLFEIIGTSRLLSVLDQTGTNITSSLNINDGTELYTGTYFSAPSGSYFTGLTFNLYNPNQEIKLYYTSSQPQFQQNSYFTTSSLRLEKNLVVVEGITGSLFGTSSYARQALSSSFASTASYALNGGGGGYSIFQISTIEDQLNDWAEDIINGVYGTINVTGSLLNSASYSNNFQLFEIVQTSRLLSVLDQTGTNITSSLNINDGTELYAGTYFSAPSGSYFTGLTFNLYNPNQEIKLYYTSSQPLFQQNTFFTTSSLRLEKNLVVIEGITGSLFGTSSYALTASYALIAGNAQEGNIFQYSTVDDQLNDWAGDIINGIYGTINITGSLLNSASYSNNFQLFEIVETSRFLEILDQTGTNITSSLNINDSTELYPGTYFSAPSGSYFTGLTFNVYNPNQEVKLYYTSSQPQYQQNSYFITSSLRLEKNLVVVEGITGSLFGTSSYALTASYAMNGGGGGGGNVDTGSFVTTSSFNAFTSSINAATSSFVRNNQTSSFVTNSQTSSFTTTSSFNAFTSSINAFTASYNTGSFTGSFTGSLEGTSSFAVSASRAISASFAITASISITESRTITFNLGSIPTPITTGSKTNSIFYSPYSGSIKGFILTSNTGSTTTLNIWKRNNTLPTSSDTIITTNKPQLINNQFTSSYDVSGWTTSFSPNDVFLINVETNTSASNLSLQLITETYK